MKIKSVFSIPVPSILSFRYADEFADALYHSCSQRACI